MKTQALNLFIVDDNKLSVTALKLFLNDKFGTSLRISTFYDGASCLENINKETNMVILDYFMEGKNGLDVLKSIKAINPRTEVIMLSHNEEIAVAIETFRAGGKDYVVKGEGAWKKITKLIDRAITKPFRVIVRGFFKKS